MLSRLAVIVHEYEDQSYFTREKFQKNFITLN